MRKPRPVSDRFWEKVAVRDSDECWEWIAGKSAEGYGRFIMPGGKVENAHRVAFYLTHGYLPTVGRHTCDNPPCCNPAHIIDGTHGDNQRDAYERGLKIAKYGEQVNTAKLTAEKV